MEKNHITRLKIVMAFPRPQTQNVTNKDTILYLLTAAKLVIAKKPWKSLDINLFEV